MNIDRKNIEDTVQELSPEELLQVTGAGSQGGLDDYDCDPVGYPYPPGPPPPPPPPDKPKGKLT